MSVNNNLMIVWSFAPLGKSVVVYSSNGVINQKKVGGGFNGDIGEKAFLEALDEYSNSGWDLVSTSTVEPIKGAFTIRAFLKKRA